MPGSNLTIDIAEPTKLSTPRDIKIAMPESLEKKVARNEKADPKREALVFRFRQAMTNFLQYKAAIDHAYGEGEQTIDKAVEIAKRLQRTKADEPMKAGILNDRKVEFKAAAGAYADETDRIKMLEIGKAKMTTTVEGPKNRN
jgi:hypothetical protein